MFLLLLLLLLLLFSAEYGFVMFLLAVFSRRCQLKQAERMQQRYALDAYMCVCPIYVFVYVCIRVCMYVYVRCMSHVMCDFPFACLHCYYY